MNTVDAAVKLARSVSNANATLATADGAILMTTGNTNRNHSRQKNDVGETSNPIFLFITLENRGREKSLDSIPHTLIPFSVASDFRWCIIRFFRRAQPHDQSIQL